MRDGGFQTDAQTIDYNTYEHKPAILPSIPAPYTLTMQQPEANGSPPDKPLPPIPPRMSDWDKSKLLTDPKSADQKVPNVLSATECGYLLTLNKKYLAQEDQPR